MHKSMYVYFKHIFNLAICINLNQSSTSRYYCVAKCLLMLQSASAQFWRDQQDQRPVEWDAHVVSCRLLSSHPGSCVYQLSDALQIST
jgi:hypothetical protein